ncbi:hypothetical protein DRQ50_06865 [bacterium]|nr:MAG: hypothetical protein DRQ50_06865 [bacterium]
MRRLLATGAYLTTIAVLALAFYEVTAKSPELLGHRLPGWQSCYQAELSTRWDPPTGIMPLDKVLHEGEEALRFYGLRPSVPRPRDPGPDLSRRSSRSRSNAR